MSIIGQDSPTAYKRACLSDSLEGLCDSLELLQMECERIKRFYPEINSMVIHTTAFGNLEMSLQHMRGNDIWQLRQAIQTLRKAGL